MLAARAEVSAGSSGAVRLTRSREKTTPSAARTTIRMTVRLMVTLAASQASFFLPILMLWTITGTMEDTSAMPSTICKK